MVSRNKDEWLNIRVGSPLKRRIQALVDSGRYPDMSTFTIEAIEEKLDPAKRDEIMKEELLDLKRRDPAFFKRLSE